MTKQNDKQKENLNWTKISFVSFIVGLMLMLVGAIGSPDKSILIGGTYWYDIVGQIGGGFVLAAMLLLFTDTYSNLDFK